MPKFGLACVEKRVFRGHSLTCCRQALKCKTTLAARVRLGACLRSAFANQTKMAAAPERSAAQRPRPLFPLRADDPMVNRFQFLPVLIVLVAFSGRARGADAAVAQLDGRFHATVQPFLQTYCVTCHGKEKTEAELDLTTYSSLAAVVNDGRRGELLLERLKAEEMPPKKAKLHPPPDARRQVVKWFETMRDYESRRNAGDPGIVPARRLSNAEYDYSIRDLTGVDLKPTREFPADPSNTAGFDNSGESLAMSPSLLGKYLLAARDGSDHMFLKPIWFAFGPQRIVAETDRDIYCVRQILALYHRQNIDYADYFRAAWRFKHRRALGKPRAALADFAAADNVSSKYLATVWSALEESKEEVGPWVTLQTMWRKLPAPGNGGPGVGCQGCGDMRDYVVQLRKKVEPRFLNITAGKVGAGAQPLLIWKNVQYATHRMTFDPAQLQVAGEPPPVRGDAPEPGAADEFGPGRTRLITNSIGDPDLVVPAGQRVRYEAAFARFCRIFPDKFYMEERGRNYFDTTKDRGRYLNAGFHSLMGYFRDDQPLYELILDRQQQQELDELWLEMDFVASATARMYTQYYTTGGHLGGGGRLVNATPADATASKAMDEDVTAESRIKQLEARYLADASSGDETGIKAVRDYLF